MIIGVFQELNLDKIAHCVLRVYENDFIGHFVIRKNKNSVIIILIQISFINVNKDIIEGHYFIGTELEVYSHL